MFVSLCCFALIGCCAALRHDDVIEVVDAPPSTTYEKAIPIPEPEGPTRNKRQATCGTATTLTALQQADALNLHNYWRSFEPGSDLFKMTWSDNLASIAQAWADQCKWEHGMYYDCENNRLGQNLYMSYSSSAFPALNLTKGITLWNNERADWNYTSGACNGGKVCGHWTQLAWSTSVQVGCGFARCPVMTTTATGATYNNAIMLACDYYPGGNINGLPFYTPGTPCSSCWKITRAQTSNRGFRCDNNLCVACDPAVDATCGCGPADSCSNQGTWSTTDCSCHCNPGFFGTTCQSQCVNVETDAHCTSWAGLNYCSSTSSYYSFMKKNCVQTCQLCF